MTEGENCHKDARSAGAAKKQALIITMEIPSFWASTRAISSLAQKGMPGMDIILAATRNVAAAYHKLDQLGTLEKGKVADLVILDASPLEDINNLQKIVMVMKEG